MNPVFQILSTCSAGEKNQLLEFCAIRHSVNSKKHQFLKLCVERPELEDKELRSLIYGAGDPAAYFQLKKRVKEELEALLPLLRPSVYSSETRARIQCSELLLQSQVMLARGLRVEGAKILEKILKKAFEFDFPDLILSIFDTSQRFGVNEVIRKEDLPELELVVTSHLQVLVNQHLPKQENPPKSQKNIYLGHILSQLNSERNGWRLVADIRQSLADRDFEQAETLISASEGSFPGLRENREVFEEFLLVKQEFLLQTGRYEDVIKNCNQVDLARIPSHKTSLALNQYHWYALFHQNRLEEAEQLLRKSLMSRCPEQSAKWKYWEAYLLFRRQSFKKSLRLIHECQLDLKPIPDYYLGSKMLELMILFDQNDTDWLDYKVENLRKLLHRWSGKIHARIESAFQMLRNIQTTAPLDLAPTLWENHHLQNLRDGEGDYHWDPSDFELIRYDGWISGRLV